MQISYRLKRRKAHEEVGTRTPSQGTPAGAQGCSRHPTTPLQTASSTVSAPALDRADLGLGVRLTLLPPGLRLCQPFQRPVTLQP